MSTKPSVPPTKKRSSTLAKLSFDREFEPKKQKTENSFFSKIKRFNSASNKENTPNEKPIVRTKSAFSNVLEKFSIKKTPSLNSIKKSPSKRGEIIMLKNLPPSKELYKQFPFSFCVQDETCSKYFRYCMEEHKSYENLLFYESTLRFKLVNEIHLKRQTCLMIIQGFLLRGSAMELNIPKEDKHGAAKKFESLNENECPNNFFDEVLPPIVYMLRSESYPRFLSSPEFHEYYSLHGFKKTTKKILVLDDSKLNNENKIYDQVISSVYSNRGSCMVKQMMKKTYSLCEISLFKDQFPFEFCIEDKNCKQYFSKHVGNLFILHETIMMYKSTKFEKIRNQIAMMIISNFLLPNSKLDCSISKELKDKSIKKFQHLDNDTTPKKIFNELDIEVLKLCKLEYENFLKSELFREYYDKFGFIDEEIIEYHIE
eukprot:gene12842-7191_t